MEISLIHNIYANHNHLNYLIFDYPVISVYMVEYTPRIIFFYHPAKCAYLCFIQYIEKKRNKKLLNAGACDLHKQSIIADSLLMISKPLYLFNMYFIETKLVIMLFILNGSS
jgi:hypothetical protein